MQEALKKQFLFKKSNNSEPAYNVNLRRPRITGDYHGQAAVLWASTAMIKMLE